MDRCCCYDEEKSANDGARDDLKRTCKVFLIIECAFIGIARLAREVLNECRVVVTAIRTARARCTSDKWVWVRHGT